ncbi:MAG: glycosyltransferase, partial [Pseudomonadota bacterium]
CQFILAGDEQGRTAYRAQLLTQIERLGLQGSVKLVGHCDDPAAAMKLADLAVVASVEAEAFGRAAVEASALETPVIVTKIGAVVETVLATPDVAEDKRTGWKVPPNDSAALARALLEALALKPDALASVGQNGRSYVMREFSLQQMIDKTLDVYQGLIEAKPR